MIKYEVVFKWNEIKKDCLVGIYIIYFFITDPFKGFHAYASVITYILYLHVIIHLQ